MACLARLRHDPHGCEIEDDVSVVSVETINDLLCDRPGIADKGKNDKRSCHPRDQAKNARRSAPAG